MVFKRSGTETSAFGTPGRINHDSTKFYNTRLCQVPCPKGWSL